MKFSTAIVLFGGVLAIVLAMAMEGESKTGVVRLGQNEVIESRGWAHYCQSCNGCPGCPNCQTNPDSPGCRSSGNDAQDEWDMWQNFGGGGQGQGGGRGQGGSRGQGQFGPGK